MILLFLSACCVLLSILGLWYVLHRIVGILRTQNEINRRQMGVNAQLLDMIKVLAKK